jgi:diaminohydroxyphosphoribosylaminopyrimidine deaminase/5-amino-6-(5-phosphoribosylamino)uracil reductase
VSDRDDRRALRRALALAARGRGRTAPNPLVGAVVVRDGRIVGEGWHAEYGAPHAEVMALRAAGDAARGATVVVTLEPCAHHGKTPPCTDALRAAGVARVVYGAADPNPVARGGAAVLREAGIEVVGPLDPQAVHDLDPAFFHAFASDRPFVTLKLALSLDGAIAPADRTPRWLTGAAARREVHRQRAAHDAVLVGIGTVLADDPLLTVRGTTPPPRRPPARVVLDRRARLPLASRLVRGVDAAPVCVLAVDAPGDAADRRAALAAAGVQVLVAPDLPAQLRALRGAGIGAVYCEGGAAVAEALLAAGAVDRLVIFRSPERLGADALRPRLAAGADPAAPVRPRLVHLRRFGDDTMAIYDLTSRVHRAG